MKRRKVVSLVRVSTAGQAEDDKTGIPRQRRDIEIHCKAFKLEVVKEFRFEGISGAHVQKTKHFRDMLAMLSKPSIAGVVFGTLDRFFRPEKLSAYDVFSPFESTGKHLFCDLGELDPKNAQDQMRIVLWGQMGGMERHRIKDRLVSGKDIMRSDPATKIDTLPQGVIFVRDNPKINHGHFEYTPFAHDVVRPAFERVLRDEPIKTVSDDLGFSSPTAMKALLRSKWWIGVKARTKKRINREWKKDSDKLSSGTLTDHDTPIMVKTNLADKPLVSVEMYDSVIEKLAENHNQWTQKKSWENELLGVGLLHCHCGAKMYHTHDKRWDKSYYRCANRVRGLEQCDTPSLDSRRTDKAIEVIASSYLGQTDFWKKITEEARSANRTDEKRFELDRNERKMVELQTKKKRLLDAIENLGYRDDLGDRLKLIDDEIAEANMKVNSAKSDAAALNGLDADAYAEQAAMRFLDFDTWDRQKQKQVLGEYIDRFVVTPTDYGVPEIDVLPKFGLPGADPTDGLFARQK